MSKKTKYLVIGLMSGTSLDGLDIAACEFVLKDETWSVKISHSSCYAYTAYWQSQLKNAHLLSPDLLHALHFEYGELLGEFVSRFITENALLPNDIDLIASHGQTIFHKPDEGFTLQIGDGEPIMKRIGIPVVYDFRTEDVALGGQGAPLVPIGDELLFGEYDQCLNLGGFSNLSTRRNEQRVAWDICPVNFVLNAEAGKLGHAFDRDGELAKKGMLIKSMFDELNAIPYYETSPPKSLGREWVETSVAPLIQSYKAKPEDVLRTFTEHVAVQLVKNLDGKVLVTGGGAKNTFLMELINQKSSAEIIIPDMDIVDYKEAMVFAFLGLLRWRNEINILASVTGASHDHSSGRIALPC